MTPGVSSIASTKYPDAISGIISDLRKQGLLSCRRSKHAFPGKLHLAPRNIVGRTVDPMLPA